MTKKIRDYVAHELSTHYKGRHVRQRQGALDIIFKQQPDLVISDVMMPEMDGLELTRRIKKNVNLNHIPVVLLTAKAARKTTLKMLETGADAYLIKPFNIDILIKQSTTCSRVTSGLSYTFTATRHMTKRSTTSTRHRATTSSWSAS